MNVTENEKAEGGEKTPLDVFMEGVQDRINSTGLDAYTGVADWIIASEIQNTVLRVWGIKSSLKIQAMGRES